MPRSPIRVGKDGYVHMDVRFAEMDYYELMWAMNIMKYRSPEEFIQKATMGFVNQTRHGMVEKKNPLARLTGFLDEHTQIGVKRKKSDPWSVFDSSTL